MADIIPTNFPIAGEQVIQSYQSVDLLTQTGYLLLYGGGCINDAVLTNITFYANPTSYQGLLSSTNLDADFDIEIQKSITFRGTAILNLPESISLGSDAGNATFTATIYKVVDAVETQLATQTGSQFTGTTSNTKYRIECFDMDISETKFSKGDILRLSITGTGSTGGSPASNRNYNVACDPKNRSSFWDTSGAVPSQLALQMPVKLEL